MLTVTDTQTTSAFIQWSPPSNSNNNNSPVAYYLINATRTRQGDGIVFISTSRLVTSYNVTGLLPGTTYELTVVAVSQGGDVVAKSQPSNAVIVTTRFSGKLCLGGLA
jgi:hypothetical protein